MPLLLLALVAAGVGYWAYANRTLPLHGSTTDADVQKSVANALQNEHDPNVLKTLALKLDALGYHDLAAQLSARADQLAHAAGLVPMSQVAPVFATAPVLAPVTALAPAIQQGIHAPRYIVSGGYGPNGYPCPDQPIPYVTITSPVRR